MDEQGIKLAFMMASLLWCMVVIAAKAFWKGQTFFYWNERTETCVWICLKGEQGFV